MIADKQKVSRIFWQIVTGSIVSLGLFAGSGNSVMAVSVDLSNVPKAISGEPFTIDVSVEGANEGTNYLRVDLYKEGTRNYFGKTFNGAGWYGGSDGKGYLPVVIGSDQVASASVRAVVGSPSAQEFIGNGLYKLRIRRYTTSGRQASGDEQTPVDVQIILSTPSPSPTVSVVPTAVPTPTVRPTSLPTPSATPLSSRTPTLPLATSRGRPSASLTVLLTTPFPSSVAESNSLFSPLLAAAPRDAEDWEVNLSRSAGTAEVLGLSASARPENAAEVLGVSVDRRIPLVLSGAGLVLVLFGLSSRWWRKSPPIVG